MSRQVKSPEAALSRTNKAVTDAEAKLRQLSARDGLENVISGLGTARDKRSYTQYDFTPPKDRQQLENMYRTSWLAKRIVNSVAEDMTREWLTVKFDDNNLEHSKKVEKLAKKLKLKSKVLNGITWSRLYGGALMIIGIRNEKLDTPLNIETIKKDSLQYLQVLDRWRVSASAELTMDLESQNFGMPDYYLIAESSVKIHHSRILRFNGQRVPYFMWTQNSRWDDSELTHVYESLINSDTATQSVASMLFEATVDVVKVENLADILAGKNGESLITKRFQLGALMKSINRMMILDGKESYENHQKQFTNLDKIMSTFMIDVCGAAEIPMTRLFGQSPSGLSANGDNDVRNYYDMISNKQEVDLLESMEYVYSIICMSSFGTLPTDLEIEFNPLWQMSDTDKSTVNKTKADTAKIYLETGVVTEGVIARQIKSDGVFSEMTDEDVELAEELAKFNAEQLEQEIEPVITPKADDDIKP